MDLISLKGWLGELDQIAQHGGCDVLEGTKWVANLWLTLVGEPGTGDAFKGWIDYGKDETKFQPGTDWAGKPIKTGVQRENAPESKEKLEKSENGEGKTEEDKEMNKKKKIEKAKLESGDGSYDVKLEL